MATSGTYTFNETQAEIIQDAFQILGIYGQGRTVSSGDNAFALKQLNSMIKAWEAQGIHIWTQTEGVLFVNTTSPMYTLGPSSSDAYAADYNTATITTLTAQVASGANVLPVTAIGNMLVGDNIGVVLDDQTTYWSTISSINSLDVTIAGTLPSVASSGNNVYDFTSRINKPMKIHNMRRATDTGTNLIEIPMVQLSNNDYQLLPNKNNRGLPVNFMYNPYINDGALYLWQMPQNTSMYFRFTYSRQLQDFTGANQTADLPVEWIECIKWQLAVRLSFAYNRDTKSRGSQLQGQGVKDIADQMLQALLDFDAETVNISIMPDFRR